MQQKSLISTLKTTKKANHTSQEGRGLNAKSTPKDEKAPVGRLRNRPDNICPETDGPWIPRAAIGVCLLNDTTSSSSTVYEQVGTPHCYLAAWWS